MRTTVGDHGPGDQQVACRDDVCITCGDVAVELVVVAVTPTGEAMCRDADGRTEAIAVDLVAPVVAGDRLLAHAGVAIANLGPAGADDGGAS